MRDYLLDTVCSKVCSDPAMKLMHDGGRTLEAKVSVEVETLMNNHKAQSGYATLAGKVRPVWILRRMKVRLENGKTLRSEQVQVLESI